jgi:hypothetical protein
VSSNSFSSVTTQIPEKKIQFIAKLYYNIKNTLQFVPLYQEQGIALRRPAVLFLLGFLRTGRKE